MKLANHKREQMLSFMGRKAFVREQILEAAFDCFARRGYEAVTSREVASIARVGSASMYRHFPSMESLGRAVYEIAIPPIETEFREMHQLRLAPSDSLRKSLGILYRNYDTRPRALALLVFPPHDFTPWEVDLANPENPRRIMQHAIQVPDDLAALCWGAILGPIQDRFLHRRKGAMSPLIDEHAAMLAQLLETD